MEEEAAAATEVKGMHPSLDESSSVQPTQEISTDAAEKHSDAVMPVSEVMAMLQTMREEQLQTLNKIADGVQQLQSQVMVLGETATASDANTRLCLERLAGVEVRIGSIPMPIAAPHNLQRPQSASQPQRVGGGVSRAPRFAPPSSPAGAERAPLPPPAAPGPSRVPTWLDRNAEREPTRPHFMRSASQEQHRRVSPATSTPTPIPASTLQAAQTAAAVASAPAALSAQPRAISAEEAAKEAKRKAFMEDRARIQERIAARKGNTGPRASSMKPSPTPGPPAAAAPTKTSTTPDTQQQIAPPQPRQLQGVASSAGNNPFASGAGAGSVGHVRASSAEPFFGSSGLLEGVSEGGGAGNATVEEEEAAWLERERAQREKKERERREAMERERKRREEEEARLARERAEAKRLKEEEEARLLREAEEARERERKKREVEARRQAKTRDIMSSLFDKGEDSGSLFGGLGAALPVGSSVFDEGGGGLLSIPAPASVAVGYDPPAEGAKASASGSVASSLPPVGGVGGSGSLFAGIRDGVGVGGVAGRGLFDSIDTYTSPSAPQPSQEVFGGRNSGYGAAAVKEPSTLFDPSPLLKDPASSAGAEDATAPAAATVVGDQAAADEIEKIFSSEVFEDNNHNDGYQSFVVESERRSPVEDYEDFLSSPPPDRGVSSGAGATSTAAAAGTSDGHGARAGFYPTAGATHARKSLFPGDDFGDSAEHHDDDDNIFSASATAQGGVPYLGSGAKGSTAAAVPGGSRPNIGGIGTSLFDRPEFSIDDPDDETGNLFAGRSGRRAGEVPEVSGDRIGTSFLTVLEDAVPGSQGQDQGGQGAPGKDGMVDVTL